MANTVTSFIQNLVAEEIRRIVADAVKSGRILSAEISADQVMRTYPKCGLSKRQLSDEVMMAAAKAGVAIEFGHSAAA